MGQPILIKAVSLLLSGLALGIRQLFRGGWIDPRSTLTCRSLHIDRGTRINGPISIRGSEACFIGKYCAIGGNCSIVTDNHDIRFANMQQSLNLKITGDPLTSSKGPVIIGNNVWIGDGAIILPGVRVGNGAIIAAGCVVTKDVPAWSIVIGVPGRVVRKRFSDNICAQLNSIQWWHWSLPRMRRNQAFFETDLTSGSKVDLLAVIRE